ncbi:hypothetical protein BB560_002092 [Smittium megazygosporum]|uniref:Uncharacterized protein n=1 Tax=Smittium megazygosporum TaxID=133381 RepID=A0A2T9Z780_9FUNG|nr:hypothetical protein BB560_005233 [Smittium megazygosporum]PVV03418.1 hypothetical protein BB560_002092 [Smittium megazygosporum]
MIEEFRITETFSSGLKHNFGFPLTGTEIRFKYIPEMNYLSTDTSFDRGKVLIRPKTIFKGFLKDLEQTRKVMLEGNWFSTGYVARINEDYSIRNKAFGELTRDPKVVSEVLKEIQAYSRKSKMSGFEILGDVCLEHMPFDSKNN